MQYMQCFWLVTLVSILIFFCHTLDNLKVDINCFRPQHQLHRFDIWFPCHGPAKWHLVLQFSSYFWVYAGSCIGFLSNSYVGYRKIKWRETRYFNCKKSNTHELTTNFNWSSRVRPVESWREVWHGISADAAQIVWKGGVISAEDQIIIVVASRSSRYPSCRRWRFPGA